MGIEVQGMGDVMQRLERIREKVSENAVSVLAEAGQQLVDQARATKTYTDRTGRLTASMGWGVAFDGVLLRYGGFGADEGAVQGKAKLEEMAASTTGLTLIVVAGMSYATYVERKGFSVLDGARLDTRQIVESLKKELFK